MPSVFISAVHSIVTPSAVAKVLPSDSSWVTQLMSAPRAKAVRSISTGAAGSAGV